MSDKITKISLALSYDDVLLTPRRSNIKSRNDIDLSTKITKRITIKLPLISINMSDVTEEKMAIALGKMGGIGFLHRFNTPQKQADMVSKAKKQRVLVGAAVGIRNGYLERAEMLVKAGADIITIDIAHGAMQRCIEATKLLKQRFGKDVDIISGVVATYEGAKDLFKAGADSVRVGVGPGTICTTRITTGVGVPQITAVMEATRAAREYKKTILCDGGTKNSGDIVKGLAAGASAAIIGSQFAGTTETPGKSVIVKGKRFKQYNASTSFIEKNNHKRLIKGLKKNYTNHIEGVESLVPFKGPLKKVLIPMVCNIRSGFSYLGAKNIKGLWKNAMFVRITRSGMRESGAHDVIVK